MSRMTDEIIEELWAIKDRLAKEHGYDLDALVTHFQGKARSETAHEEARLQETTAEPSTAGDAIVP